MLPTRYRPARVDPAVRAELAALASELIEPELVELEAELLVLEDDVRQEQLERSWRKGGVLGLTTARSLALVAELERLGEEAAAIACSVFGDCGCPACEAGIEPVAASGVDIEYVGGSRGTNRIIVRPRERAVLTASGEPHPNVDYGKLMRAVMWRFGWQDARRLTARASLAASGSQAVAPRPPLRAAATPEPPDTVDDGTIQVRLPASITALLRSLVDRPDPAPMPAPQITVEVPPAPAPVINLAAPRAPDVHVTVEALPPPRPRAVRVETLPDGTRRFVPEDEPLEGEAS
jgi:hypothetical protein